MAFAFGSSAGLGASGVSGTTMTLTPSSTIVAGNLAILGVAGDNTATSDGDNNEIVSVSDNAGGNTWTKCAEYDNGTPGAALGSDAGVFRCLVATDLTASVTTITVTFANAIVDKCCVLSFFTIGAGNTITQSAAAQTAEVNAAAGFGTMVFSGLSNIERLYVMVGGKKANATTLGTASAGFTRISGTRSRNNAAAQMVRCEFSIATATGATSTYVLSTVGNTGAVLIALEEVPPVGGLLPRLSLLGVG